MNVAVAGNSSAEKSYHMVQEETGAGQEGDKAWMIHWGMYRQNKSDFHPFLVQVWSVIVLLY